MVPHPITVARESSTTTAAVTTTTLGTTTTAAGGGEQGTAASELAAAGKRVYDGRCAECHGAQGEGVSAPALIGDNASLSTYGDGAALFAYIKRNMPADNPGSLSDQETLQVTAYVLLDNGVVEGDTSLSIDGLSSISLS
jgi:cytochrome c